MELLILIAEEQPAIRELLWWALHLTGYRAIACVTREAILTWREQVMIPSDLQVLILLDLSPLSVSEVADFLCCVRARWLAFFTVPPQIIVLTTQPNALENLRPRECVLLKPFHVRNLITLIQQATESASEDASEVYLSYGE